MYSILLLVITFLLVITYVHEMFGGDSASRSFWGSYWINENSVAVPKMSLHPAGSNFDASVKLAPSGAAR